MVLLQTFRIILPRVQKGKSYSYGSGASICPKLSLNLQHQASYGPSSNNSRLSSLCLLFYYMWYCLVLWTTVKVLQTTKQRSTAFQGFALSQLDFSGNTLTLLGDQNRRRPHESLICRSGLKIPTDLDTSLVWRR